MEAVRLRMCLQIKDRTSVITQAKHIVIETMQADEE